MTIAFPKREASDFHPQSAQQLRAIRASLIEQISPRTVDELEFLRSIDQIEADDERTLETILALNFVIGDEE